MGAAASRAAERAARLSYGKLVAMLAARSRDLAAAEDALSGALLRALERWPEAGVPANPDAWLLTVARRIELDRHRRSNTGAVLIGHWALLEEERKETGAVTLLDERLKLLLVCAHPAIEARARTPLMLQMALGLDLKRIGSAFLMAPAAMGQRLSRAKAKIKAAGIRFEVPDEGALPERIDSVLDAVYASYTLGWDGAYGADGEAAGFADEAIWLAHLIVELLPAHPEAEGLLALLLFCESRRAARRGPETSRYVPLAEQDTALWSLPMVEEAEGRLRQAAHAGTPGRYQLEAAIQSVHADRRRTGRTDWTAIAQLYAGLVQLSPTIGARIGQALAVAETQGPTEALALLDAIPQAHAAVRAHQPYWAARAHLLARLMRPADASEAYDCAIGLCEDPAVRSYLQEQRQRFCPGSPDPWPASISSECFGSAQTRAGTSAPLKSEKVQMA